MNFLSAIREVHREELALLLPMSPGALVEMSAITRGSLTITDAVLQDMRSTNQEAVISGLPKAGPDVQPSELPQKIATVSNGDSFPRATCSTVGRFL